MIVDDNANTVYELKQKKTNKKGMTESSERQLVCLKAELKRTGVTTESVKERNSVEELETMSDDS